MVKGLVTVVVPIYNTEKYLDRCINSIVNQTYRDLEILLIDDGSPDSCPEKCDMWALRDNRIRVLHKENEGQGIARNVGIENSDGEYIYFVDSDDYIAEETIEKAYNLAIKEQADIVVFGFSSVDPEGRVQSVFVPEKVPTFRGKSVQEFFLPELIAPDPKGNGKRRFYMSAWLTLFSMNLIKKVNWRFISERAVISEETYSMMELLNYAESAAVLPEAFYYYCSNADSFSRKYMPGRYLKCLHFYQACINLCEHLGYGEEIKHRVSKPYLAFTLATLKQEMQSSRPYVKKYVSIKEIINDPILQRVLQDNKKDHVSLTRRIMFWAMRNKLYMICCALLCAKNGGKL